MIRATAPKARLLSVIPARSKISAFSPIKYYSTGASVSTSLSSEVPSAEIEPLKANSADIKTKLQTLIDANPVFVASKSYCPYCGRTKSLLDSLQVEYKYLELDLLTNGDAVQSALFDMTTQKSVPNIFINKKHIGGNSDLQELNETGKLQAILEQSGAKFGSPKL